MWQHQKRMEFISQFAGWFTNILDFKLEIKKVTKSLFICLGPRS